MKDIIQKFGMQLTPYSFDRLYGPEKYNLQYMLLRMVNFPAEFYPAGDKTFDIHFDRARVEVDAVWHLLKSPAIGDAFLAEATDESVLAFAGKLFAILNNQKDFHERVQAKLTAKVSGPVGSTLKNLAADAAREAVEEIEPIPVTGVIMVRFTDSGGYPSIYMNAVIQRSAQRVYNGNDAPFVTAPRERMIMPNGMEMYRDEFEGV